MVTTPKTGHFPTKRPKLADESTHYAAVTLKMTPRIRQPESDWYN